MSAAPNESSTPNIQLSATIIELHESIHESLYLIPKSNDVSSPSPLSDPFSYSSDVNGGSGYERRRAIRRIDRAVESLTSEFSSIDDCCSLDETTTDDLVTVLTTLSQMLFTDESEVEVVGTAGNLDLYKNSCHLASRLLIDRGILPLCEDHVDVLLDRVATLCLDEKQNQDSFHKKKGLDITMRHATDEKSEENISMMYPVVSLLNASLWHSQQIIIEEKRDNPLRLPILYFPSLSLLETVKICELLIRKSLRHLTIRWTPPVVVPEEEGATELKEMEENRECMIELRMLIEYLLLHFFSFRENSADSEWENSTSSADSATRTKVIDNHRLLMSDFSELLKQYLVEIIEYALDAIDGASSHYRSAKMQQQQQENHQKTSLEDSDQLKNDEGKSSNLLEIIRDAIRHVSMAVNVIEISQQEKNYVAVTCPFSSLTSLFTAYANFSSSLSHDDDEVADDDMEANTFSSADELLVCLLKMVRHRESSLSMVEKRQSAKDLKNSKIQTFLRILGSYGITEDMSFILPIEEEENNIDKENMITDSEITHILQAATATSVLLPEIPPLANKVSCEESHAINQQNQMKHLTRVLLEKSLNNESPMDPWHSLVAKKIAQSVDLEDKPPSDGDVLGAYIAAIQSNMESSDKEEITEDNPRKTSM